jgi:hypothetical protein
MNEPINRPCRCGCSYDDHAHIFFRESSGKYPILYCRKCSEDASGLWCYNYAPIGNLDYLQWLYDQQTRH